MVLVSRYEGGRLWWLEGGRVFMQVRDPALLYPTLHARCCKPLGCAWLPADGLFGPRLVPFARTLSPVEVDAIVASIGAPVVTPLSNEVL